MLPRKRTVPAEPAANPFALGAKKARVSVSDEITSVQASPLSTPAPVPSPVFGRRPSKGPPPLPTARPASPRGSARPGRSPMELPRASVMAPPSHEFDRAAGREGTAVAALLAEALPPPIPQRKPPSSDAIEPMSITHHPAPLARPSASWAMALVALGVFGGVVTAIVAGGETDSILRAGVTFIDPSAETMGMPRPATLPVVAAMPPLSAPPSAPASAPRPEPAHAAQVPSHGTAVVAAAAPIIGEPIDLGGPRKNIETLKGPVRAVAKTEAKVAAPVRREPPRIARAEKAERHDKSEEESPKAERTEKAEAKAERVEKAEAKVEKAEAKSDKGDAPKLGKKLGITAAAADALAKAQLEGAL